MDDIKISICMPTRNRAGFIGAALDSVISQADDRVEIVIVDGASTDGTQAVVDKYRQKFSGIVYCRQEKNGGVDMDMAKAITTARGEYCWLLSDDDALKPGAIQRMLEEAASGYEIFLTNVTVCDLYLRPIRERCWLSKDVESRVFDLHEKGDLIEYCNKADSIGALFSFWSSIVLRRETWVKSGYARDFDGSAYALAATLFSSIGSECRLKYIKEPLILWRNDNLSFQDEGGLAKRFLLDFDGYMHMADKYMSFDPDIRRSFLSVMRREHPWYTVIHAATYIDNDSVWEDFKARLSRFGYSDSLIRISRILRRYKTIIFFGVKIKRKIVKSRHLHWFAGSIRAIFR
jgi:abequosyltransferase